jgi:TPR repeat protein
VLRLAIILMVTAFAVAFAQAVGLHPQQAELAIRHKSDFEQAQSLLQKRDFNAAVTILRQLASSGYAPAEAQLGILYITGEGVKMDSSIGSIWFYRAARQGLPSAQLAFGSLYIDGRGVVADLVQAHMWLNLAAVRNDGAIAARAKALIDQIENDMSANEIQEARARSQSWRPIQPLSASIGY